MTLQRRIEDYVGKTDDVKALDVWLTVGARRVISAIPAELLQPFTRLTIIPSSGIDVTVRRILGKPIVRGFPASMVSFQNFMKRNMPESMYFPSVIAPIYIVNDNFLKVYPWDRNGQNYVYAISFPVVSHGDETISTLPTELTHAVVLYASFNALLRGINNTAADLLSGLNFTLPERPTPPTAPEIVWLDIPGVTIDDVTVTPPTSVPEFMTPVLDSSNWWDFQEPNSTDSAGPYPAPPTVPTINVEGIVGITDIESPPAFDADAQWTALTQAFADEDIELASARTNEIAAKLQTYVGEWKLKTDVAIQKGSFANETQKLNAQLVLESQLAKMKAEVEVYTATIQGYIAQVRVGIDVNTAWRGIWELQRRTSIDAFKAQLDASVARFQVENAIFQSELQRNLADAQLKNQKLLAIAEHTKDIDAQNRIQAVSTKLKTYEMQVQAYASEAQAYAALSQGESQRVDALVKAAAADIETQFNLFKSLKGEYMEAIQSFIASGGYVQ